MSRPVARIDAPGSGSRDTAGEGGILSWAVMLLAASAFLTAGGARHAAILPARSVRFRSCFSRPPLAGTGARHLETGSGDPPVLSRSPVWA